MADQKISDLVEATDLAGTEFGEIIQGGVNKKISPLLLNPYRGDYSGTTVFPSSGGRFTGGAPMRGDRWRLTDVLVVSGSAYDIGTIIEAAVDNAGASTISDWIKYAVQP